MGRVHVYAQLAAVISGNGGTMPPKLKSSLIKSIDDGYANADRAVRYLSVDSSFSACKNSVTALWDKYVTYYNYIKKNNVPDLSTCNSYFQQYETALRNFRLNQFTSSYNSNDKRLVTESMNSSAVSIINGTYTKFYNLRAAFSKTSLNYADSAYNTLGSNASLFADAAADTYKVKAYGIVMGDNATIKSNYDALYKRITAYIHIDSYVGKYDSFYNAVY